VFKLGCLGCLTVLILLAFVGFLGWGATQIVRAPEGVGAPTSAADGQRAQQKIFEVMRRAGSGRPHTVALSDREVNAFLERHVEDLPLRRLSVQLPGDARAEIAGQIPFRQIMSVAPLSSVAGVLPDRWLDRGIWLSMRTRATLESTESRRERKHLRLDVERFALGRLRLPEFMMRVLLDPVALRFLRVPMPDAIDGLRIEPGRLVLQST